MNEPWFNPGWLGLFGGIFGILGGIIGTLAGVFVPRGKAKKLTLGVNTLAVALGFILFVFGIVAFLFGQPRDVWLSSVFVGLSCAACFSLGFWIIPKRAREAELRKMMSEDLTLESKSQRHNNEEEDKENSNE